MGTIEGRITKKSDIEYVVNIGLGHNYHVNQIITPELWDEVVQYAEDHPELLDIYVDPTTTPEYIKRMNDAPKKARLEAIDKESVRAMRAILAGVGNATDQKKLEDLEAEAKTLRNQL